MYTMVLCVILLTIPWIPSSLGSDDMSLQTLTFTSVFSPPQITSDSLFSSLLLPESSLKLSTPACPQLPKVVRTFELPKDASGISVQVVLGTIRTTDDVQTIQPAPVPLCTGDVVTMKHDIFDTSVYGSDSAYPSTWYSVRKGAGITAQGDHVVFLTVEMYPVRYHPRSSRIEYTDQMMVQVTYHASPQQNTPLSSTYDLIIISPQEFSDSLLPLVTHKNEYGIATAFVPLETIYDNFTGRDHPEQIKYFVKYALETWGVQYVLLVGDMTRLPIRSTLAYPWDEAFGGNILSDLYYADLYNDTYGFCSWDGNNNSIFGETNYSEQYSFDNITDLDGVDLYPDVCVGRLACTSIAEVQTMVDKIMVYELQTSYQNWFKRIILAGGDTFPPSKGSKFFVYEGEITNTQVAQQLPDFEHVFLWSSKRNLNAFTFNQAINKGAGFLTYAGHGFEHGWGTYKPNALRSTMGLNQPLYYTPFIKRLKNEYKLPVMFFDACLTAKLDYNISDLYRYYTPFVKLWLAVTSQQMDPSVNYPCFAWSFLAKQGGGAIAAVGATRPAYTWVDEDGVYAGAGFFDVHFFKAYHEGVTLGQMMTAAQTDYLNQVFKDYFTLEEFMVLGDPSLRVGGYPSPLSD